MLLLSVFTVSYLNMTLWQWLLNRLRTLFKAKLKTYYSLIDIPLLYDFVVDTSLLKPKMKICVLIMT